MHLGALRVKLAFLLEPLPSIGFPIEGRPGGRAKYRVQDRTMFRLLPKI